MDLKKGGIVDEVSDPRGTSQLIRKTYSAPELTRFGKVSQLTQSASGCAKSDNPACTADPGSNMGVKSMAAG